MQMEKNGREKLVFLKWAPKPAQFETGAATAVFSIFFARNQTTLKAKSDGDQKLRENAQRIFKPFFAPFWRCSCFTVSDFQTAAPPEPGKKRLKNASRVLY